MKKRILSLLLAAVLVLALAACGSDSPTTDGSDSTPTDNAAAGVDSGTGTESPASPNMDNVLKAGTLDSADGFDPTVNSNCGLGLYLVYDTILKMDPETKEVYPNIASSYEWVDDLTFVMEIRDDVYFSNGELLKPSDVVFSLKRFTGDSVQFETGYKNIDFDNTTIDGNTITFKLLSVDPDFPVRLANDRWSAVLCESYVSSMADQDWWDKPVGTGAYTVVENISGSHATYERRDEYWGEMPQAKTITITYYAELTTMMIDYATGAIDIALNVGVDEYNNNEAGSYADSVAELFNAYDILSITMPQYMEVFQDIRVRQAVAMALDTTAITKAVYGELGTPADSCLISGMEFYVSQGVNEYNPERAKELLAEAGYEAGDIELLILFPSMPTNEKTAVIVQEQLAQIGITVKVESGDFATVIPRLMNNECQLGISGTGGGTFLANQLFLLLGKSGTNASQTMLDEEFNAYIDEGDNSTDSAVRAEAYAKAQQWVKENYWYIPVSYSYGAVLHHTNISNVTGITARQIDLSQVTFVN